MAAQTPILPAHIEETVHAIAELHAQHHRNATPIQRTIDRLTRFVGQPLFMGMLTVFIATWILVNLGMQLSGPAVDPFPFDLLQGIGTAVGVYIAVLILITQRRENELAEHREQLTLELAILGEQKNAKIIQLLEELRRDHPMIRDRDDPEAVAMAVPADPQAVLDAIKESHEEAMATVAAEAASGAPLHSGGS